MEKEITVRTGRHCVFHLHAHLVFTPKYRKQIFTSLILRDMEENMKWVCQKFESDLKEFNGETDHVHLLVTYPPKIALSKLVNSLKGASSRVLLKKHASSLKKYLWKGHFWSPSYFAASCGGAPLTIIKEYIAQQNRPK